MVSKLGAVAHKPSAEAWVAIKRLLRYLRGTVDVGLRYGGSEALTGYSDTNWAEGPAGKSTTGVLFILNGGPIHWYSKKQTVVALSTCEAEYVALATATQEAAWLGPHLAEMLGIEKPNPVGIQVDNQGAIALVSKSGWNRRTRHINVLGT